MKNEHLRRDGGVSSFPTKRIWLTAIIVSIIITPFIHRYVKTIPWLITIPIIIGALIITTWQLMDLRKNRNLKKKGSA